MEGSLDLRSTYDIDADGLSVCRILLKPFGFDLLDGGICSRLELRLTEMMVITNDQRTHTKLVIKNALHESLCCHGCHRMVKVEEMDLTDAASRQQLSLLICGRKQCRHLLGRKYLSGVAVKGNQQRR